jgi:hypothetical protein
LVRAAELLDEVYWQQTSKYGRELRDSLEQVQEEPIAINLLALLKRNGGPFEKLQNNIPFMGLQKHYAGEEFYPRGLTQEEFDKHIVGLSETEKKEFMSPYTVIQRSDKKGLKAVRYYQAYKKHLDPVIRQLNEAADITSDNAFANFLKLKAKALQTDDYFDVDVSWIELENNKFDIVFGPLESYDDGIKGIKAKYAAYIEVVDQQESKNLALYSRYLQDMENNLPIPDSYKSVVGGLTSKFVVVQDVIRMGRARVGYQDVAANLPNDAIIKPVSHVLIEPKQVEYLTNNGFSNMY